MTDSFETCPYCSGTGRRIVPPPIGPRGNSGRRNGQTHGYESTYQYGCRCDLCKAGHRQYRKTRRAIRGQKAERGSTNGPA